MILCAAIECTRRPFCVCNRTSIALRVLAPSRICVTVIFHVARSARVDESNQNAITNAAAAKTRWERETNLFLAEVVQCRYSFSCLTDACIGVPYDVFQRRRARHTNKRKKQPKAKPILSRCAGSNVRATGNDSFSMGDVWCFFVVKFVARLFTLALANATIHTRHNGNNFHIDFIHFLTECQPIALCCPHRAHISRPCFSVRCANHIKRKLNWAKCLAIHCKCWCNIVTPAPLNCAKIMSKHCWLPHAYCNCRRWWVPVAAFLPNNCIHRIVSASHCSPSNRVATHCWNCPANTRATTSCKCAKIKSSINWMPNNWPVCWKAMTWMWPPRRTFSMRWWLGCNMMHRHVKNAFRNCWASSDCHCCSHRSSPTTWNRCAAQTNAINW